MDEMVEKEKAKAEQAEAIDHDDIEPTTKKVVKPKTRKKKK
jgi:hypothetical protein